MGGCWRREAERLSWSLIFSTATHFELHTLNPTSYRVLIIMCIITTLQMAKVILAGMVLFSLIFASGCQTLPQPNRAQAECLGSQFQNRASDFSVACPNSIADVCTNKLFMFFIVVFFN